MTLQDQPNSVWNKVLDAYIETKAVLEARVVRFNSSSNDYTVLFLPDESWSIQVEEKIPVADNINILCDSTVVFR